MGRGRAPCCDKSKVKRGPWSPTEDLRLINFIHKNGHANWRALPKQAGLLRCGKSCRLRWINYLRPDVKRGNFTPQEEQTIINLHNSIGNKWSKIASCLPGRTDNEIKNVWNTHLKKRLMMSKNIETNNLKTGSSSVSPSCTSSSITTCGDQDMEIEPTSDRGFHGIEPKKPRDDSANIDCSASPIASGTNKPSGISGPETTDPGNINDPDKSDVFDSDIDFWEFLDSLEPFQSDESEQNGEIQDSSISHQGDKSDTEVECSKWLRFLENKLGLNE